MTRPFTAAKLDAFREHAEKFSDRDPFYHDALALVAYCRELRRVLNMVAKRHRGCATQTKSNGKCDCGYGEARRLLGE